MTRIIAGTAGGRSLRTPPGDATRPTTDRVREALFSVLESRLGGLDGVAFLDLYAGSGAVGLEAASRGARPVTLVEQDRRTAGLVRRNAADLGLEVVVAAVSVARFLDGAPEGPGADVAFLDPPYAVGSGAVAADLEGLARGWLAQDALVVVERSSRERDWAWPQEYAEEGRRVYGETVLRLGRLAPAG